MTRKQLVPGLLLLLSIVAPSISGAQSTSLLQVIRDNEARNAATKRRVAAEILGELGPDQPSFRERGMQRPPGARQGTYTLLQPTDRRHHGGGDSIPQAVWLDHTCPQPPCTPSPTRSFRELVAGKTASIDLRGKTDGYDYRQRLIQKGFEVRTYLGAVGVEVGRKAVGIYGWDTSLTLRPEDGRSLLVRYSGSPKSCVPDAAGLCTVVIHALTPTEQADRQQAEARLKAQYQAQGIPRSIFVPSKAPVSGVSLIQIPPDGVIRGENKIIIAPLKPVPAK